MKKRKQTTTPSPAESVSQWRRRFALDRRKEGREKEKNAVRQRRQETFRRKVREAGGDKAPETARTKGYYPFSRTYPAETDENGCREVRKPTRRVRRIVFAAVAALLAFALAYTGVTGVRLLAKEKADDSSPAPTEPAYQANVWQTVPESMLRAGNADAIAGMLEKAGASTAVFPFKDETGYVYFDVGSFHGMTADRQIASAADTVRAVQELGYRTAAYLCCFSDNLCAWAEPDFAVRRNTTEETDVWLDNSGGAWLNPYSDDARNYLLGLVEKTAAMGFDYVLLDRVAFPTDVGISQPTYPGEETYTGSRNALLKSFVAEAVAKAGDTRTVLAVEAAALQPDAPDTAPPYYGNLLNTAAGTLLADARPSLQPKNMAVGAETFVSPANLPFVFALAVGDALQAGLAAANGNSAPALWIENGDMLADELDAARLSDVPTVVLWQAF